MSQTPNSNESFREYLQPENYVNVSDSNGTSKDVAIRDMQRIWYERLYPHGNPDVMFSAYRDYVDDFNGGFIIPYPAQWNYSGPTTTNSTGTPWAGRINRIKFDPLYGQAINGTVNQTIYACSNHGGLWRSLNAGQSWYVVGTDSQLPISSAADVAISHQNNQKLALATGLSDDNVFAQLGQNLFSITPLFTAGMYRSFDGGENWIPAIGNFFDLFDSSGSVRAITINPENENQVYAATTHGLLRCNNFFEQGQTPQWVKVLEHQSSIGQKQLRNVLYKPDDANTVYTSGYAVWKGEPSGGNNGITFTNVSGTTGIEYLDVDPGFQLDLINIAVTPAEGAEEFIYAYLVGYRDYVCLSGQLVSRPEMYLYLFDGTDWVQLRHFATAIEDTQTPILDSLGQPTGEYEYNCALSAGTLLSTAWMPITVHPSNPDRIAYGFTLIQGTLDLSPSTIEILSGALNFVTLESYGTGTSTSHADCRDIAFEPIPVLSNEESLFAGHDGGVSAKTGGWNHSGLWQRRIEGLEVGTIWSFDSSEKNKGTVYTAHQDNGIIRKNVISANFNWNMIGGGDGYGCQIADTYDLAFRMNNPHLNSESLNGVGVIYEGKHLNGCSDNPPALFSGKLPLDLNSACRADFSQTFKFRTNERTNTVYGGLTEVYKRKKGLPGFSDTPDDVWELSSDIHKNPGMEWNGN